MLSLIGITRNYADIEVDKPVRDASMNLLRSIPRGMFSYVDLMFDIVSINVDTCCLCSLLCKLITTMKS